jgi:outer membrane autotransporter protein
MMQFAFRRRSIAGRRLAELSGASLMAALAGHQALAQPVDITLNTPNFNYTTPANAEIGTITTQTTGTLNVQGPLLRIDQILIASPGLNMFIDTTGLAAGAPATSITSLGGANIGDTLHLLGGRLGTVSFSGGGDFVFVEQGVTTVSLIQLGLGDDRLTISNGASLIGDIAAAQGDNVVFVENGSLTGDISLGPDDDVGDVVTIGSSSFFGLARVTGNVDVGGAAVLMNRVRIQSGAVLDGSVFATDQLPRVGRLDLQVTTGATVTGSVNGGSGADAVAISDSTVGGSILLGAGDDSLSAAGVTSLDGALVDGGQGVNTATITGAISSSAAPPEWRRWNSVALAGGGAFSLRGSNTIDLLTVGGLLRVREGAATMAAYQGASNALTLGSGGMIDLRDAAPNDSLTLGAAAFAGGGTIAADVDLSTGASDVLRVSSVAFTGTGPVTITVQVVGQPLTGARGIAPIVDVVGSADPFAPALGAGLTASSHYQLSSPITIPNFDVALVDEAGGGVWLAWTALINPSTVGAYASAPLAALPQTVRIASQLEGELADGLSGDCGETGFRAWARVDQGATKYQAADGLGAARAQSDVAALGGSYGLRAPSLACGRIELGAFGFFADSDFRYAGAAAGDQGLDGGGVTLGFGGEHLFAGVSGWWGDGQSELSDPFLGGEAETDAEATGMLALAGYGATIGDVWSWSAHAFASRLESRLDGFTDTQGLVVSKGKGAITRAGLQAQASARWRPSNVWTLAPSLRAGLVVEEASSDLFSGIDVVSRDQSETRPTLGLGLDAYAREAANLSLTWDFEEGDEAVSSALWARLRIVR